MGDFTFYLSKIDHICQMRLTSKYEINPDSPVYLPTSPPPVAGLLTMYRRGSASVKDRPYVGIPIMSFSLGAPRRTHLAGREIIVCMCAFMYRPI